MLLRMKETEEIKESKETKERHLLLSLANADKLMRDSGKWNDAIDRRNTAQLKKIIQTIGWPTRSKVGSDASSAAWLLAQHADHDVGFQEHCLNLMKQESKEEIDQVNIAYLEDRVLLNRGKKQIHGTQFQKIDGKLVLRPIQDIFTANEKREAMGMEPLKEDQIDI